MRITFTPVKALNKVHYGKNKPHNPALLQTFNSNSTDSFEKTNNLQLDGISGKCKKWLSTSKLSWGLPDEYIENITYVPYQSPEPSVDDKKARYEHFQDLACLVSGGRADLFGGKTFSAYPVFTAYEFEYPYQDYVTCYRTCSYEQKKEAFDIAVEHGSINFAKYILNKLNKNNLDEIKNKYSFYSELIDSLVAIFGFDENGRAAFTYPEAEDSAEQTDISYLKKMKSKHDCEKLEEICKFFVKNNEIYTQKMSSTLKQQLLDLIEKGREEWIKPYYEACMNNSKINIPDSKEPFLEEDGTKEFLYSIGITEEEYASAIEKQKRNLINYIKTQIQEGKSADEITELYPELSDKIDKLVDIAESGNFSYISDIDKEYMLLQVEQGNNLDKIKDKNSESTDRIDDYYIETRLKWGAYSELKEQFPGSKNLYEAVSKHIVGEVQEQETNIELPKEFDNSEIKKSDDKIAQVTKIVNAKKLPELTEEEKNTIRKESREQSVKNLARGVKRVVYDIISLGLYELIRSDSIKNDEIAAISKAEEQIAQKNASLDNDITVAEQEKRDLIYDLLENMRDTMDVLHGKFSIINTLQKEDYEIDKQVKTVLYEGLIDKINDFYRGLPVRNMPNCVMLTGYNAVCYAKNITEWIGEITDTDFKFVPSRISYDEMQKDLYKKLNESEENYQKTKKRTIIFVEGMEKLLIPKLNSDENIAEMKDIMQCVSDDYHATLVFVGCNPERYARGINTAGRIGLKVNSDIYC